MTAQVLRASLLGTYNHSTSSYRVDAVKQLHDKGQGDRTWNFFFEDKVIYDVIWCATCQ